MKETIEKSPAFMWYPKDILGSARVAEMSLAEEGAYRRLLDYCWINGSVPADPKRAAKLIGKGATPKIAQQCLAMFTPDPNDPDRMLHERMEKERSKQNRNRAERKKAADSRWGKSDKTAPETPPSADSKCNANALQKDMQKPSFSFAYSSDVFSSPNGSEKHTHYSGVRVPQPDGDAEQDTAAYWTELGNRRLDSPFENPKWAVAIDFAVDSGISAGDFGACIDWLRSQEWRRSKRITPEVLTGNLPAFLETRSRESDGAPDWRKAIDDCPDCDAEGLVWRDGGYSSVCRHEGRLAA